MRLCLLPLALGLAVMACGSKTSTGPTMAATKAPVDDDPSCPLLVPGTSVAVEDTANGAALVFVTTGDALAVRSRAATLAAMYTKHDGPADAMGMMFTPGATATATEVEGGARVELAAPQPDGAAAIQNELRMHAGHLTGGTCKM